MLQVLLNCFMVRCIGYWLLSCVVGVWFVNVLFVSLVTIACLRLVIAVVRCDRIRFVMIVFAYLMVLFAGYGGLCYWLFIFLVLYCLLFRFCLWFCLVVVWLLECVYCGFGVLKVVGDGFVNAVWVWYKTQTWRFGIAWFTICCCLLGCVGFGVCIVYWCLLVWIYCLWWCYFGLFCELGQVGVIVLV